MSDSLPPDGGPGPYDGWDLEGLLSGDNVWLPEGMRPVAGTLAALRSAPSRTELSSEAAARAAFRDIMRTGETGPVVRPAQPGSVPGDANTLILTARPPDGGPRPVARPRHSHRRPPRRGRWRSKAFLGAAGGAAAVVIVGGIALAGTFSGSGGHAGQSAGSASGTSAAPQTSRPGSNGVEGTASTVPSPTPTHTSGQQSTGSDPASEPSQLCRQYLEFIAHPGRFDQADESGDFQQLSTLAGGPWHIIGYCMRLQPWAMMPNGDESDAGGPGFPPGSQGSSGGGGSQGNEIGQHGGNAGNSGNSGSGPNGNNGVGNAGNDSKQSVSGPGPGNQNQR